MRRRDDGAMHNRGGTGLGLAITATIKSAVFEQLLTTFKLGSGLRAILFRHVTP
jgi:hypothetical protein